jgi:hypothetical protein
MDPAAVRHHLAGLLADHGRGLLSREHGLMLITYLLWLGRPRDADALFADLDAARDQLPELLRARLDTLHIWFAYFYPSLGARYHRARGDGERVLGHGTGAVDRHSDGAIVLASLLTEGPTRGAASTAPPNGATCWSGAPLDALPRHGRSCWPPARSWRAGSAASRPRADARTRLSL